MKALILVGGFGTRLRPLTLSKPKPMVEFVNKAMVHRQLEELANVGVKHVVLAVSYRSDVMEKYLRPLEKELNITITISQEEEPLGTAGPLALAREHLTTDDSPFFVLNSDVICTFPFKDLLDFHKAHGKIGTIFATKVEDPSKYGVILTKEDGQIYQFVEKPQEYVGNRINAGLYIFNPQVLDFIELKPTSIEKEVFPKLAFERELYAFDLEGFWMDVGQPPDFLKGMGLYFSWLEERKSSLLSEGNYLTGPNIIHPTAKIGADCIIGPNVSIGPNCVIESGVRLSNCCIMENCTVKSHSRIEQSIIGWNSRVGRWCLVTNVSVLGEDVGLKDEVYVNGARILPHKTIGNDILDPTIIM